MRERHDIVALWHGTACSALATLVGVEGSSYRRPGARLLLADEGHYAGAISGGCLEAELLRKARWSVRNGPVVQRFSTDFDDPADIPYGLGCGGIVDVLLEPAGTAEFSAMMHALEASLQGQAQLVRTWLPQKGQRLRRSVRELSAEEQKTSLLFQRAGDGLIEEMLLPPQRLVVCGAGDDARPLISLASLMGWDAVILDGRAQWARSERFPEAKRVQVVSEPAQYAIRADDAVVIMTHSYEQDREWLAAALAVCPRYLGLLGSRHRSALLFCEAAAMLHWSIDRVCEQVFAPIGLDLGGDGAASIALAIVAEIHACLEGRLGSTQRMTARFVAEQAAKGDASRYLQPSCVL